MLLLIPFTLMPHIPKIFNPTRNTLHTLSTASTKILLEMTGITMLIPNSRQGFGRQANKSPNPQQQAERQPGQPQHISTSPYGASNTPPPQSSPSLPINAMASQTQSSQDSSRKPPYFFRDDYSGLVVKGNFMTLATKPTLVERGEWLAHQGV